MWKLKWNNEYSRNTQAFFYWLHGIWICPCENLISSSSKQEAPDQAWRFGCEQGLSLGQATCCWLAAWSWWVECIIIWLPSKNASCLVGRDQPPPTRERREALGQGHLAMHLELAWLFKVHHGEGSRRKGESSSDAWVWWAVLSCLPKKWDDATMKMFLCLYSTPEDNLSLVCQVTEDKLS